MTNPEPVPTVNFAATFADKAITDVFAGAVPVAEAAIIAAQPWLGLPVIKQLWEALFSAIVKSFGAVFGLMGGYLVIDVQKYRTLLSAADALSKLKAAQASGDPHAIQQANDAMDAAVAPVLHYVGSVRP